LLLFFTNQKRFKQKKALTEPVLDALTKGLELVKFLDNYLYEISFSIRSENIGGVCLRIHRGDEIVDQFGLGFVSFRLMPFD